MSTVYLAVDIKLKGKMWAIKEITGHHSNCDTFVREAEMLIGLDHPYLPRIVDYYEPDESGVAYLVMDYISGQTLEEAFQAANKKLPAARIIRYAIQICQIFSYLHHRRPRPIIYRDLKPGNIIIDAQDRVRLIDFGIARAYKPDQMKDTARLGTVGFAAPEQHQGRQTDVRTDLYTLGAMIYYLLSGGVHYNATEKPIQHYRDDLPHQLAEIVDRLLQSVPEHRYRCADDVMRELSRLQDVLAADNLNPDSTSVDRRGDSLNLTDSRQRHDSRTSVAPPRLMQDGGRLTIIGSLYPGAGSTFVGLALARTMHWLGIPHSYVENPTNPPDLHILLYGDKHAPRKYRFICDRIADAMSSSSSDEWVLGHTTLYPVSPDGWTGPWTEEYSSELLQAVQNPHILIDISGQWEDEHVQRWCRLADHIVVVADASPSKMFRPSSRAIIRRLLALQSRGKPVHLIANRDLALPGRKMWLESQFIDPLCCFPMVDSRSVIAAEWQGKLVQDREEVQDAALRSLSPLLAKLAPEAAPAVTGKKRVAKI